MSYGYDEAECPVPATLSYTESTQTGVSSITARGLAISLYPSLPDSDSDEENEKEKEEEEEEDDDAIKLDAKDSSGLSPSSDNHPKATTNKLDGITTSTGVEKKTPGSDNSILKSTPSIAAAGSLVDLMKGPQSQATKLDVRDKFNATQRSPFFSHDNNNDDDNNNPQETTKPHAAHMDVGGDGHDADNHHNNNNNNLKDSNKVPPKSSPFADDENETIKDIVPMPQPMPPLNDENAIIPSSARGFLDSMSSSMSTLMLSPPGAHHVMPQGRQPRPQQLEQEERPLQPGVAENVASNHTIAEAEEGLVQARQVVESANVLELPRGREVTAQEVQRKQQREREWYRKLMGYCVLGGLGVAMIVVVIVAVTTTTTTTTKPKEALPTNLRTTNGSNKSDAGTTDNWPMTSINSTSEAPSAAPSIPLLIDNLPQYTLVNLQNPLSPQSLAYEWLENHPDIDEFPQWRRRQLFALGTYYYAFDGPTWPLGINEDWMDHTRSECQWWSNHFAEFFYEDYTDPSSIYVVHNPDKKTCNEKGEFTVLYLGAAADAGYSKANVTFPLEMSFLTALRVFNWRKNGLEASGEYPLLPMEYYQHWTELEVLNLGENKWNTAVPTELGLMTNLQYLALHEAQLHGPIPSQLGLLTNLLDLALPINDLSGTLPTELEQLTLLRSLRLDNNLQLSGQIPNNLTTELDVLDVTNIPMLSGTMPSHLCTLEENQPNCATDGYQNHCPLRFDCTDKLCGCNCTCSG